MERCQGRYYFLYIVFLTSFVLTCSQNNEDEVLRDAIAKDGKNQWLVAQTSTVMLSTFFVFVGPYFFSLFARLQSSAKLVGFIRYESRMVQGNF